MALLSWRTSDGQTGQWLLNQPFARVGRAEGNDLTVPDGSVSSVHAEVAIDGNGLVIRDLGSTNGTFVYDQRVQQALLEPGQNFRLGNVEFSFLQEAMAPQTALPAPPSIRFSGAALEDSSSAGFVSESIVDAPPAIGPVCFYHPGSTADFTCTSCSHSLCTACQRQERIGKKLIQYCTHCGGKCVPYGQPATPQPQRRQTFRELLPTTFKYPLKGNGLILLITGTFFFGFLDVITTSPAMRIPFIFVMSLMVRAIMYGYLFAYMQKIVSTSSDGDDQPPNWPEVTDLGQDVYHPFWLFFGTMLASFGPGLFLYMWQPLPGILLMLIGAFYFPMALLAVAMADSLMAINPLIVFSAILKVPGAYTISVIVCGFLVLLRTWIPSLFEDVRIPIIPTFVLAGIALFVIMIEMRILGVLYYTNKEKFGWF